VHVVGIYIVEYFTLFFIITICIVAKFSKKETPLKEIKNEPLNQNKFANKSSNCIEQVYCNFSLQSFKKFITADFGKE
jgi:hypothetical protein